MRYLGTAAERMHGWARRSELGRLAAAAITIASLSLVARVGTVVQDLLTAARFGISDAVDALLLAYIFPTFAINVLASSITASLIPGLIHARENGSPGEAQHLASNVIGRTILGLLGGTALLAVAVPLLLPALAISFSPEKKELTIQLFYLMLPILLVGGLSTLWTAVLNAGEHFVIISLVPMVTPLVAIVALLFGTRSFGIHALAGGLMLGALSEALTAAFALQRSGISPRPAWSPLTEDERGVLRQYPVLIVGGLLMGSSVIIDQAMAATLGSGSIAALSYGRKVVSLILGIGTVAIGTAVFPHVSKVVARREWATVRSSLRAQALLVGAATVPVVIALVVFSNDIIRLLYERGEFEAGETAVVSRVHLLFALQIPFFLLGILGVRLLSAVRRNDLLMKITAVNMVSNVTLNYFLMRWIGVSGIALSTTLVQIVSTVLIFASVHRQLRRLEKNPS